MADMKPIGIDQTTGQERPVAADDSLVKNLGDTIEVAVTQVYDFSGNVRNNVQVLFLSSPFISVVGRRSLSCLIQLPCPEAPQATVRSILLPENF